MSTSNPTAANPTAANPTAAPTPAAPDDMVFMAGGFLWKVNLNKVDDAAERAQVRNRWSRSIALADAAAMGLEGAPLQLGPDTPTDVTTSLPRGNEPESAYAFSGAVTRQMMPRLVGGALLIHAAALARDDIALAFVGPSGTGKTTATATLGTQLDYITDETTIVLEDFSVLPYPKPLSIITDPETLLKEEFSPGDLGLGPTPTLPTLGGVVLLERNSEFTTPTLEPMGLGDAILRLCPETSSMPRMTHPLGRVAAALGRGLGVHLLRYAEIESTRQLIDEHLAATSTALQHASTRPSRWWSHLPPPAELTLAIPPLSPDELPPQVQAELESNADFDQRAAMEAASAQAIADEEPLDEADLPPISPETLIERAPWTDALLLHHHDGLPDDALLLLGMVPVLLQGAGGVLWANLSQPRSVTELVEIAQEHLGEHPDAMNMVTQTVRSLLLAKVARVPGQ